MLVGVAAATAAAEQECSLAFRPPECSFARLERRLAWLALDCAHKEAPASKGLAQAAPAHPKGQVEAVNWTADCATR